MKAKLINSKKLRCAVDVFDDKWTALLVNELLGEPSTFCELECRLVGISPRTLSQRLDKLEAGGIVKKEKYCIRPPRYKYKLTKKGQDLQKILQAMLTWGAKHG